MIFVSANSGSSPIDSTNRRIGHQLALAIAAENRGEVEAEPVHVIVVNPIAETMENHLADDRVVAVEGIAAAGVVAIGAAAVLQHVVDAILQALETERGAIFVPLGRVVEHDVENHFDARPVQRPHHLLELAHLAARLLVDRVAAVGGKKGQRVVAPVGRPLRIRTETIVAEKLENRHQLHCRHAQRLQVRYLLDQPQVGARMTHPARLGIGESANVHLVDHRLVQAAAQMAIALPIELVVDDHALGRTHDAVVDRQAIARQGLRVRIDEPGAAIETQPAVRLERSIGLKVIELTGPGPGHKNAPDVAPAVQIGIEIDDIARLPRGHVPIQ